MANSKRQLYQGTAGASNGIIEHDCMNCEASWDLKNQYEDMCPYCGSYDVVKREAFDNPVRTIMSERYHDHNGGYTSGSPTIYPNPYRNHDSDIWSNSW